MTKGVYNAALKAMSFPTPLYEAYNIRHADKQKQQWMRAHAYHVKKSMAAGKLIKLQKVGSKPGVKKKCSHCGGIGHNVRACPELYENTKLYKCGFCGDLGHNKRTCPHLKAIGRLYDEQKSEEEDTTETGRGNEPELRVPETGCGDTSEEGERHGDSPSDFVSADAEEGVHDDRRAAEDLHGSG